MPGCDRGEVEHEVEEPFGRSRTLQMTVSPLTVSPAQRITLRLPRGVQFLAELLSRLRELPDPA